ncbi:lysylphosphatidylglycerol synthase transmembrane domain-containing protein [Natronorubrum daqingense]|uniref:TIGR00374 family protein n=1 Tax=Natronorubrum daqingense TaxID=588898 RepID=A0A1N7CQL0_9EURY|nr:lysylphosphatidylglycerol synthase transmembrane domain-containing protein [Natronorubrum daqingense]APX97016.1 TIGR00374 family protein [Natronorubrum daqingense]SIR65916.1 hypothetical protein SAMN05421809_1832 [Natronorubrum daqingense]
MRRWRAAAGFAVAVAVVALFVYGVGWDEVLENIQDAHPGALAGAFLTGLAMLAFRAGVVKRLLDPIDGAARGRGFVSAFLSGYFARSALPWGRSTGTPVMAYLLATSSDSEFEDNLAVVAVGEAFNFFASLVVAGVGFGMLALTVGTTETVTTSIAVASGSTVLAVGIFIVALNRGLARTLSLSLASWIESIVEKLPRVPTIEGTLTDRIDGFFRTLEVLQASRRTLAVAIAIAIVGWVFNALPLYFSLLALGVDTPVAVALLCAPLASLGGIVPLPGGTGGIEVVLASLLVGVVGIAGDTATAAAILYRVTTYWLHLGIGGIAAIHLTISGPKGTWMEEY